MQNLVCYATDHVNSKVICGAFAEGSGGRIAPPLQLLNGPAMVYGILRGCDSIIRECGWVGRDYFYVDHGYFDRGYWDGYFRVCKNGLQTRPQMGTKHERPPDRWEALSAGLRPWKREGRHIVVCPISQYVGKFLGIDPDRWTATVARELSLWTDRPVVVKPKNKTPLKEALIDAWCLVTHSSNAAVDAITAGIPAIVLGESAAAPVSWRFQDIESPFWPAREPWAWTLAHHQFTVDEMRRGIDLAKL